ncbi:purine and uridine phosphorylase, partial [Aureobasidium pullulans]
MAEFSDPHNYTVGWICAVEIEYTAAELFLDKTHPRPLVASPHDANHYTCGTIAGHNVVMAVLPDGEYGVGSAASVVTNMLHSFPNVRIGLMVGIGGGAPTSKNDIRLGDVVVSSPRDGHGGVYQFDFGKAIQGVGFVAVRAAIPALKRRYRRRGNQIKAKIESILNDEPRLRDDGFTRPSAETDRLYTSDTVHSQHDQSNCINTCAKFTSSVVTREVRRGNDDDPTIHYGLIASGNQLMKDAKIRDKLANEKAILCFEMEAAGIMNRFPCMVIRGICDYSDSHKNKEWQGWAAMTAAAYAKDLLEEILPTSVKAEKTLAVVVQHLFGLSDKSVSSHVLNVAASVGHIQDFEQSGAIKKWLNAPDPSVNHNNALEKHHPGTGRWFLEDNRFLLWKQVPTSFLWLHGLSGCGKTVLSSIIIENLTKEDSDPLLFFYFDFSDPRKQSLDSMLRSLLNQLYHKSLLARAVILPLYKSHDDGSHQLSAKQMEDTLQSIARQLPNLKIIVDAIDESDSPQKIIKWFERVYNAKCFRLLVISRKEVLKWSYGREL